MTANPVFGASLDSEDVEQAMIAHLQKWMPTYIAEVRRQKDPEGKRWPKGVPGIRSYDIDVTELAAHKWPESQLPCVIVGSPGEDDDPRVEGDRRVTAFYGVTILCVASGGGKDPEANSKALARLYGSAARMAIMQHPDLGEFANGVGMRAERNDTISRGVEASRSLAGSARAYVVEVENVVDVGAGPLEPLEDPETPPEDWPTVKKDGGSADVRPGADAVELLREGGFFED